MGALIVIGLLVALDVAAVKWGKNETHKNGWGISR